MNLRLSYFGEFTISPLLIMTILLSASLSGCTIPDPIDEYNDVECDNTIISPQFSLKNYGQGLENTLGFDDPPPKRIHRSADILAASGDGDEPTTGSSGPDVVISQSTFFNLPPDLKNYTDFEIDALSGFYPLNNESFNIAFSVSTMSQGNGIGSTWDVRNQSRLNQNHLAGDVFFALPRYDLSGTITNDRHFLHHSGTGSTLSMDSCFNSNQIDLDLAPNTSRELQWPNDVYDDIDALSYENLNLENKILFSLSNSSRGNPNLIDLLPENTNGADVLMRHQNGTISTYAKHEDMGLWSHDELDSVVVFDDGNQIFDANDTILFSLAEYYQDSYRSPTLEDNNWSAGDILVVQYRGIPKVFSSVDKHGLDFYDELNALSIMANNDMFGEINFG